MSADIPFSDYIAIRNVFFEWAESYDLNDWERLKAVLAPSVRMDYTPLGGPLTEDCKPEDFAGAVAGLIGDKRVRTQHFLGASRWKKLADGSVEVEHQARVAHSRFKDETLTESINHGHAHGTVTHTLKKTDGEWKIIGYTPRVDWTEYDLAGTLKAPEA